MTTEPNPGVFYPSVLELPYAPPAPQQVLERASIRSSLRSLASTFPTDDPNDRYPLDWTLPRTDLSLFESGIRIPERDITQLWPMVNLPMAEKPPEALVVFFLLAAIAAGCYVVFLSDPITGVIYVIAMIPTVSYILRAPAHFRREQDQLHREQNQASRPRHGHRSGRN